MEGLQLLFRYQPYTTIAALQQELQHNPNGRLQGLVRKRIGSFFGIKGWNCLPRVRRQRTKPSITTDKAAALLRAHHLTTEQYRAIRRLSPQFPPYCAVTKFLHSITIPTLADIQGDGAAVADLFEVLSFLFKEIRGSASACFHFPQFPKTNAWKELKRPLNARYLLLLHITSDGFKGTTNETHVLWSLTINYNS